MLKAHGRFIVGLVTMDAFGRGRIEVVSTFSNHFKLIFVSVWLKAL